MKINDKNIDEIDSYNSKKFNRYLMSINNIVNAKKLMIYYISRKMKDRTLRTYSRYSRLRRINEKKMISKFRWYDK